MDTCLYRFEGGSDRVCKHNIRWEWRALAHSAPSMPCHTGTCTITTVIKCGAGIRDNGRVDGTPRQYYLVHRIIRTCPVSRPIVALHSTHNVMLGASAGSAEAVARCRPWVGSILPMPIVTNAHRHMHVGVKTLIRGCYVIGGSQLKRLRLDIVESKHSS